MRAEYDPQQAPDAEYWLSLDEMERIALARSFHRKAKISLPNEMLHATFHATIETQIALGDELPVKATLRRLIDEGLDRHEAVHAIGSILAEQIYDLMKGEEPDADINEAYFESLSKLSASSWFESYSDTDDA